MIRRDLRLTIFLFALSPLPRSQGGPYAQLLLPAPVKLSGIVVDPTGMPIGSVQIDHHNLNKAVTTDIEGRFAFQTRAPAIVFRKKGYDGEFLRVQNGPALRIVLRPTNWSLPVCPDERCTLEGWHGELCFPKVKGLRIGGTESDVDYSARWLSVKTKHGRKGIRQGLGPLWSLGIPLQPDVWESAEYSERSHSLANVSILEARGKTASGKLWRYLGMPGESASYNNLDESDVALLDEAFDGVCVQFHRKPVAHAR